jgi:sugar/nucleoside kinase (ribokinase family)
MADLQYDVVGVGNAIVDVLARVDESFISENGLDKGTMTLIDEERARELYDLMPPAIEISGGSAANTLVGIVALGGRGAYVGKVRNDHLGEVFHHELGAVGVHHLTPPAESGESTARSLVLVTPDAQRTMQTYLGISVELAPNDIDEEAIASAQVTYLEGYLFDRPQAKRAFARACELAHGAGRKVALSLSDPFCVERHRAEFRDLVSNHVDLLFANEDEIRSLYEVPDTAEAARLVGLECEVAALTCGENGSMIVGGDGPLTVEAEPAERVEDTTGAGDLYAAGFLFGYTNGYDLPSMGRIGSIIASEAIGHLGARPERDLADLIGRRLD